MTTLEETAVPVEASCRCSGSSSPRSIYSQEMIFCTSLVGRVGIPEKVVLEVQVAGSSEVTVVVLAVEIEMGST